MCGACKERYMAPVPAHPYSLRVVGDRSERKKTQQQQSRWKREDQAYIFPACYPMNLKPKAHVI